MCICLFVRCHPFIFLLFPQTFVSLRFTTERLQSQITCPDYMKEDCIGPFLISYDLISCGFQYTVFQDWSLVCVTFCHTFVTMLSTSVSSKSAYSFLAALFKKKSTYFFGGIKSSFLCLQHYTVILQSCRKILSHFKITPHHIYLTPHDI